jgi:hypothetical protein
VLEINDDIPIVSSSTILISLKEEVPKSSKDLEDISKTTFIGFVSEISPKGVTVRFSNGLTKLILPKDLESSLSSYKVGQVVRTGKNKLGRLTLKQKVIYFGNQKL